MALISIEDWIDRYGDEAEPLPEGGLGELRVSVVGDPTLCFGCPPPPGMPAVRLASRPQTAPDSRWPPLQSV